MTAPSTTADHAFVRYRDHGRPEDLAEVFDGCAPNLLLLANHVAGDANVAEDLVQLTFLKAIEGAQRFEPGRPVRPWLVGILVREAKKHRRQASRTADRDQLSARTEEQVPAELAEMHEFQEALGKALDDLPQKYREVLTLRLVHGLSPTEIGHVRGVSPETIKTQIKRGTERLKNLLPPSFATVLIALAATGAGLASVREAVLGAAATAAETLAATAAGTAAGAVAAQAPDLVSTAAQSLSTSTATTTGKALAGGATSAARKALWLTGIGSAAVIGVLSWPNRPDLVEPDLPEIRETIANPIEKPKVLRATVPDAIEPPAAARVDTALATFSGRVIGKSGLGIAGLAIELLRFHPDALVMPVAPLPNWTTGPNFVAGTAMTDDRGRFSITAVKPSGVFLLGIDTHGERIEWRLVDRTPGVREDVDLGLLQLGRRRVIQGRMLDRNGMPIVGARLRHVGQPFAGLDQKSLLGRALAVVGTDDFEPDGAVIVRWGKQWQALQVPTWFRSLHDRVLARSITTDARGRFTWITARSGPVELVVKRASFATRHIEFEVRGERQDVGEFKMKRVGSVRGSVTDELGDPVKHAEIMLAKYDAKQQCFPTRAATTTGDDGLFELDWQHPDDLFVMVRRGAGDPWHIVRPTSPAERIQIAMPRSFDVFVRVVARHGSTLSPLAVRPVFRLVPAKTDSNHATGILTMHQLGCVEPLLLAGRRSTVRKKLGEVKLAAVPAGDWILMVSAEGHGAKAMPLTVQGIEQVNVELSPLEPTDIALDDPRFAAMDGLPVFARGFSERDRIFEFPVFVGETDEEGGLSLPRSRWRRHAISTASNELGSFMAVANAGVDRLAIRMPRCGVIDGMVTENGEPATPGSWLLLARQRRAPESPAVLPDSAVIAPVRVGGLFRFRGLEPGEWRVTAVRPPKGMPHPSHLLPVLFPDATAQPAQDHELVSRGELSIAFETTVPPEPSESEEASEPKSIHGVVQLRSQTAHLTHIGVAQHMGGGFHWSQPDAKGAFDSGIVPTGPFDLIIITLPAGEQPGNARPVEFLWLRPFLASQRRIELSLDLMPTTFAFRVAHGKARDMDLSVEGITGADGLPARCRFRARTDSGGWFRLDMPAGTYRIRGEREWVGSIDKRGVQVTTPAALTFDLTPPLFAAGRALWKDIGVPLPSGSKVEFERLSGGATVIRRTAPFDRSQRFRVAGLLPGEYKVTVHPALRLHTGYIQPPEDAKIPVPQGTFRIGVSRTDLVLRQAAPKKR